MQSNVLALLRRDAVGQKKYGCTMDRQDLSTSDWLQHALEETLDLANYLRAAINKEATNPHGENTPKEKAPLAQQNAKELERLPLSIFLLQVFRQHDARPIREALNELFTAEPILARIIGNAYLNWQASNDIRELEKGGRPNTPPDVMLKMVADVGKQTPNFFEDGLAEFFLGVKFVDATPKNQ